MSARRLADQLRKTEPNGVLFADQWNNLDNAKAHYDSTGPEIWEQTGGKIDGFICSVGTGGTLAGTSRYLKEKNKDIVIACADPRGAAMYELFKHGEAKSTPGGSITEGIGLGRVTPVIEDRQGRRRLSHSGRGSRAGDLRSARARRPLPRRLDRHQCRRRDPARQTAGPGKTIVTILCDSGNRYQSKLFNPDFMRSKNLPVPEWLEKRTEIERAVRTSEL